MSFPKYTPPSVEGVTFAIRSSVFQKAYPGIACSLADAVIIQKYTGGTAVNAAADKTLGYEFKGLDPASDNQPWAIIGIASPGLAGPAVALMWGFNSVNGGGIGNPGTWEGIEQGNPHWVPQAPAPPPPHVPVDAQPGMSNSILGIQVTPGQVFTAADRLELNDIRRLVVALAKAQGIS